MKTTKVVEVIKKIRRKTGLSFSDIKRAVEEAKGNEVKALDILKSLRLNIVEKKTGRTIKAGIVDAYIHSTKKIGTLIELGCETDFVSRNPDFQILAHELAMHIAAANPESLAELLNQNFIKDEGIKISDLINQNIAKLGENIKVGEFVRFEI